MASNIRVTRICQFCGDAFIARTTKTKYCGDPCAKKAYKKRKREERIKQSISETGYIIQKPIVELQAKEFLTIKETIQISGISRTSLWRLIKRGELNTAWHS
ncbi:MAG: DNA-binding protein [Bacteroidota bacterium]